MTADRGTRATRFDAWDSGLFVLGVAMIFGYFAVGFWALALAVAFVGGAFSFALSDQDSDD